MLLTQELHSLRFLRESEAYDRQSLRNSIGINTGSFVMMGGDFSQYFQIDPFHPEKPSTGEGDVSSIMLYY